MSSGPAPFFDLGEGGLPLALVQGLSVAALFSAFGALLFLAFLAPSVFTGMAPQEQVTVTRPCLRLARLSLLFAVLAELAWLVMESATLAGAADLSQASLAVPAVVSDTEFGHLVVAQILLLIAATLVLGWARSAPATCCRTDWARHGVAGLAPARRRDA